MAEKGKIKGKIKLQMKVRLTSYSKQFDKNYAILEGL